MVKCVFIIENWIQAPSVCRYFLNGNCRYGDFCRNSHIIQNEPEPVVVVDDRTTDQEDTNNNDSCTEINEISRNWIDAPEFIPRYISQNTDQTTNDDDQGASR